MQEMLKVYSLDGQLLHERDISGLVNPLMLTAGERPELVEVASPGVEVVGALVRDGEGWTLVSRRGDLLVKSGPKSGPELQLTVGIACEFAGSVYRLEREGDVSGDVLVWRFDGAYAADPLEQGRNIVGSRPGCTTLEVNPAVLGSELCEVYPTAQGVDVVTVGEDAARLSVPKGTLFAVGMFQGMVLDAADAAKAMRGGNPFGWPARGTRQAILAAIVLLGLVGLGGMALEKELSRTRQQIRSRVGAEQVAYADVKASKAISDEDVLVYELAFYRSLGSVLGATRSRVTSDLIKRGQQLESSPAIRREVAFLKDVEAIQSAVLRGDWPQLGKILAAADRAMFTKCDGDTFFADAQEISEFITQALPRLMAEVSKPGSKGFASAGATLSRYFEDMKDNVFMSGEVIRRERDAAFARWEALSAYVPARDAYLKDVKESGQALLEAWAGFEDAFGSDDPATASLVADERKRIAEALLARAEKAQDVALIRLCDLGEAVGVDPKALAQWRKRADVARRALSRRYRELYGDYRMKAAVAPGAPETLAVLDRMVALGLPEDRFHEWALRELERVKATPSVDGKAKKEKGK